MYICIYVYIYVYIYKTFLIYRTCMRRAPAKPVRAFCESGVLFHMSHLKLHFALHTSHCTLHTPHFISSELFSPYPSSSLLICHLSFHESLPSTTSRTCMRRAPARPVRACFVRSCCSVVVQEHDLRASPVQCNVA